MDKEKAASTPIDEVYLSVRAYNALRRFGVNNLGDLTSRTRYELLQARDLGVTTLAEIEKVLDDNGLKLKPDFEQIKPKILKYYSCPKCPKVFTVKYEAQNHCPLNVYFICLHCEEDYQTEIEANECSIHHQQLGFSKRVY